MSVLFGYLIVGFGMYLSLVHFGMELDRSDEPRRWVIILWPIVYLLGVIDLIDWLMKEYRKNE